MSQLLFNEKCISEAILNEMETLDSLVDKKTTLLSAVHTTISLDHKKLKVVAIVLMVNCYINDNSSE